MASSLFLPSLSTRSCRELLFTVLVAGLLFCPDILVHGEEIGGLTIKVDQVGYPLIGPKVALVSAPAELFEIRRSRDNTSVFRGALGPPQFDPSTGDQVRSADFSRLQIAGAYGKNQAPWPGLLAGGPNAKRQDSVLAGLAADLPPAKVYVDQTASFASNEIAINWQASLVFLLAGQLR